MATVTLKIVIDDDPINPREDCDNLVNFAFYHKRYALPNDSDVSCNEAGTWDDLEDLIVKRTDAVYIVPVYMYDHSGITISSTPFDCSWDSGQIGFAYITRPKAREWFNLKRLHLTDSRQRQFIEATSLSIAAYDEYLRGDAYGYSIEVDGESIDSYWGFLGDDHNINGIRCNLEEKYHPLLEKIGNGTGEASMEMAV